MNFRFKLNYLIIPIIVAGIMFLGSIFVSFGMPWYNSLEQSSLTPPGFVFSIAWTIISILTSLSIILFWNNRFKLGSKPNLKILSLFVLNGVFNILWTYLFFFKQLVLLSIIDIVFIELTLIALIYLLWKTHKASAYLLMPYFSWVLFALFLNIQFWLIN